jgi:amino acid adenylation domain-containing protein
MLVNEFLEQSAEKFPDKVAIVCQDRRTTYLEIEASSNSLSHGLIDQDLNKQDRAAVYLDSSLESVVSLFAILKAGGVFLVINPQVKAQKAEYILNDCQVKTLFTDSHHLIEISAILPNCPDLKTIIITDSEKSAENELEKIPQRIVSYPKILEDFPQDPPQKKCIDIDLASLIYTSGSTGVPKGVMCTHLNMASAASSIIEYLENTPEDIILNVLPISFDYGLYQVLMGLKFGGTVVLEKTFLYPYKIIDLLIKENITGFPIVPTIAAILLKLKNLDKNEFPALRYLSNTAQALPPKFISELQNVFPTAKIYSMYGLTECKRVSYLPPSEIKKRPTSVGIAMPNTEVYIVDEEGNRIDKPDVVGELVVRGANVMKGYWNLPEETDSVYKPGPIPGEKVLYTGDLFKQDEEGFLYFIARKDDVIKVAGERVSPKEIENVLHSIEGVNEAAVVGVDDDILGQAIKAFVSMKKGHNLSEDDILRCCAQNLESFMIPKYVEIVDELPRSAHGKIAKKELKNELKKELR